MPRKRKKDYDPNPLQELLKELLEESNESYREASSAAGLHPTTVSNYMRGTRPMRDACIALADHFGINPNKMLEAAGYEPLYFFDKRDIDLSKVGPEGKQILEKLERITDQKTRQRLFKVIDTMLDGYLLDQQKASSKTEPKPKAASKPEPTESG
jgi:transcriptional regulator with XRE-family HTH domain